MDSIPLSTLFISLAILLFLSAFFSSSETGLMSLNRYKMRHLAESGHKGAKLAEKLLNKTDVLLSLILICNNLVNIAASAIATVIGMRLAGDAGVAIATGALTFVMLVFSEILPKTIAAIYPEKIGFFASYILTPLKKLLMPLVFLMNLIISALMKLLRVKKDENKGLSAEELRGVVLEAGKFIPTEHQEMLISILDMEKVTVEDIMVPRNDIGGIDIDDDWKSIMRQLNHAAHARVVLYKGNMDKNVLGMLRVREAFRLLLEKDEPSKETLIRAVDEVYFIPEGTPLTTQLMNFKTNKERIGLVVDEYGDIKGLVTLEDILEEIVGEFTTSTAPSLAEEVKQQSDGSVIIEGSANLRDLNKLFGWNLPVDEVRTFNGLILEHLEKIPDEDTQFELNNLKVTVLEVADNMVKQAKVEPISTSEEN
ncbi:HlyC/CorC family transporter [Actinobacillus equuli subsp. equuli]|uniref:Magnesium and cobalt efflux protein n=1 Tax=Actinobacillus equuli TaxID=718 RepID=A0AAX3FNF3_ACTEU|nr:MULTISPECIES: HlyC/CorC family transporter [Actinobacillus]MCQ9712146.1 HlyC/CorC family transporter [Actinobacillus suis]MDG4953495.1 HlyC/CorC family transporter [Actinobacillus equuli subsp. equuli]WGE42166.1 HlyC/CorC family transporter [Actinobacillus equuli subsp. haemolyticus]WGE46515.1 HlyC/CorC family transporter [Actinobacillus equuli subsp. haemolyticus]WGE48615.1 HlyC/CorC family transporter [Actinobacillus equuli subsp. equuli]